MHRFLSTRCPTKKVFGDTVVVRVGLPEGGFDGIRKGRVNVAGRPCVVEERRIIPE